MDGLSAAKANAHAKLPVKSIIAHPFASRADRALDPHID
jgi:hypothetical protein